MVPTKSAHGLYIVRRNENFAHWCAWREWLATRCQKTFHPEVMTVWLEWPPQTMEEVRHVVEKLNESRKVANADTKIKGKLLHMLPDELMPWEKWDIGRVIDMERRHRTDAHWNPRLDGRSEEEEKQITLERANAVIEATRRRLNYTGGKDRRFVPGVPTDTSPPQEDQKPPPRWHTDAEFAEIRRKALKRPGDRTTP